MIRIHPGVPALPVRSETWTRLLDWGVTVKVHDSRSTSGGGYWWPDKKLVELFTGQLEAAIHEVAHAFWDTQRERGDTAPRLVDAVIRLAEERDPRYGKAAMLAGHYVHGIRTQPDPSSPTGYWLGMKQPDGTWMDWEMFAGLASGVMGDLSLLPSYVRPFYEGLFDPPAGR